MIAAAIAIICTGLCAQILHGSPDGLVLEVAGAREAARDFLAIKDLASDQGFVAVPCRFRGESFSGAAAGVEVSGSVRRRTVTAAFATGRAKFVVSSLQCTVRARPPRDRAIVVRLSLPLDAVGWKWWDDTGQSRTILAGKHYEWIFTWPAGQRISRYPLCALTGPDAGVCAAVPLDKPRVFRFSYDASARRLNAYFDIGLSPDARKMPCRADFEVVLFPCDAAWGFRDAVQRYYAIFPDYAKRRAGQGGIWLLGFDPGPMACPWDFGFRFDEGAQFRAGYDCAHGILPFVYTEPWGKYEHFGNRPTPDGKPRYGEKAPMLPREELRRLVMQDVNAPKGVRDKHFGMRREIARAIVNSAIYDRNGEWIWRHWTDEWSPGDWLSNVTLNPDPDLPEPNRASVTWKYELEPAFKAAAQRGGELAGVYLDSVAGFMGLQCENFRREHWAVADVPLIASRSARQPAQLHCFACYEFAKQLADEMHRRGKLVIANTFRPYMQFFCHLIDMVGAGEGRRCGVAPHELYRYLRFYGFRKPISFMDYGFVDPDVPWEKKEQGMQLCLLYAVHPGTGAFRNPAAYEPSRPLFRHYEPLICWLDEAGWQPVTRATAEPAGVLVERYGPGGGRLAGVVFLTLHLREGEQPCTARVTVQIEPSELGMRRLQAGDVVAWELVKDKPLRVQVRRGEVAFTLPLQPGRTCAVAIAGRGRLARLWMEEAARWLDRTAMEAAWLRRRSVGGIVNSGFEDGTSGWGIGAQPTSRDVKIGVDERAPLSGRASLRVESLSDRAVQAIHQNINLPAGEYELTFKYRWTRPQGARGVVIARFGVKGPDGKWAPDKYIYFRDLQPTGRLETYRARFQVPPGHRTGFFQFLFNGQFGVIVIDDISVNAIRLSREVESLGEIEQRARQAAERIRKAIAGARSVSALSAATATQRAVWRQLRPIAQATGQHARKLTMPLDNFAVAVGRAVEVLAGVRAELQSGEIFANAPKGAQYAAAARLVASRLISDVAVIGAGGAKIASRQRLAAGESLDFSLPIATEKAQYGWADALIQVEFTALGKRLWLPWRVTARLREAVEVEPRGAISPAAPWAELRAWCFLPGGCTLIAEGKAAGRRVSFRPLKLAQSPEPQTVRLLTDAAAVRELLAAGAGELAVSFHTQPPAAEGRFTLPIVPGARCPELARPPRVDGRAGDWQASVLSEPVGPLRRLGGGGDPSDTAVFVGRCGGELFVLFKTRQPAGAPLQAHKRPHDSPVWGDDCVEIFLQPPSREAYYHFIVNLAGSSYEARVMGRIDASWGCPWKAAVGRQGEWWIVEVAIPLKALVGSSAGAEGGVSRKSGAGAGGGIWRANFCRHIAALGAACSWAPVKRSFHDSQHFGHLAFVQR